MANSHHLVGSGPHKVIVLHGWFGDGQAFAPMERWLTGSEFTYAFMDYRGYGGMKDVGGSYTMDEIAADTLALADALGWPQFSLIGHSMGGKAIQRVLARAPSRVNKLVALTPVPAAEVPFDEAGWALFSGAAENPGNRFGIIDFTTGNRLSKTWLDQMVSYSLECSTKAAFAGYLLAWAKGDFSAEVKGLPHPVKVIVGAHDGAIGADTMKATFLTWFPNAEMDVLENSGHYPMHETPVALATTIETFLRR
jgi:esterase